MAQSTLILSASPLAAGWGWEEMLSRGFRASSPVPAVVRLLCVLCRVRIHLQGWSGKIKLPDCVPRAALCPAQEQEGFSSLLSSRGCADNSHLALFIGMGQGEGAEMHMVRQHPCTGQFMVLAPMGSNSRRL